MGDRKQSDTTYGLYFMLIGSSDHITGLTGKAGSVTVSLSKNGAAGGAPAGAISEVDATNQPGLYKIAGNATDSNTLGPLFIHAKDAASDPEDCFYNVVVADPFGVDFEDMAADVDATETRVTTALPNAAPQAAGGLITSTAGGLDLDEMNADIEAIQTSTAGLTFTVAGKVDANALQIGSQNVGLDANNLLKVDVEDVNGAATLPELAQGIPASTPSLATCLMLLYMALRNNSQATATLRSVLNDAGTVIAKGTMSDDGTTYQQGKLVSGP